MLHPTWPESDQPLQDVARSRVHTAGLPEYESNVPFDGKEIDVLHRDRNAAIELNWWSYHGGRRAYRRDHAKARALARIGVALFQVAGEDLDDDPNAVIDDVRAYLAHHPPVPDPVLGRRPARAPEAT